MYPQHLPWEAILLGTLKLLAKFGLIPGGMAAFGVRKLYQKWRQKRAIEGWQAAEARILWGKVHREGPRRIWAEITYSYFVDEYRSGTYIRKFRHEEDADEFVRQAKEKRLQVRYDGSAPEKSVFLDRDIEMVILAAPEYR